MADNEVALLIMKASADLRKAAALDRKRRSELQSLADYLESIIYEKELDDGGASLEPEDTSQALSTEEQIKQMMKPFRVRLTR